MKPRDDISAKLLRSLLHYDPTTGALVWRPGALRAGELAGWVSSLGYRQVKIGRRRYMAHRLAWLHVHGEWPKHEIDHINGAKTDNRIANLRDVPVSINQQNRKRATRLNGTGLLGVSMQRGRLIATIVAKGKQHYLGRFETPEAAHAAYVAAKRRLHKGCTL